MSVIQAELSSNILAFYHPIYRNGLVSRHPNAREEVSIFRCVVALVALLKEQRYFLLRIVGIRLGVYIRSL